MIYFTHWSISPHWRSHTTQRASIPSTSSSSSMDSLLFSCVDSCWLLSKSFDEALKSSSYAPLCWEPRKREQEKWIEEDDNMEKKKLKKPWRIYKSKLIIQLRSSYGAKKKWNENNNNNNNNKTNYTTRFISSIESFEDFLMRSFLNIRELTFIETKGDVNI